jgi:hypothetical protein
LQASLHEGLARAHAAAGHADYCDAALQRAHALIIEEPDAESRAVIEEQIASVPMS